MRTSSAKAKGRRFQQWVRDQLIEKLEALSMVCESRYSGWFNTINLAYDPTPLLEANNEEFIENILNIPINFLSNGPDRNEIINLKKIT